MAPYSLLAPPFFFLDHHVTTGKNLTFFDGDIATTIDLGRSDGAGEAH
jgi:hypothetical protein